MKLMRPIFILLVVVTQMSWLVAQEKPHKGLVLRGRIYATTRQDFKDHVIWRGRMRMELTNVRNEFTNEETEPAILINPNLQFGTGQAEVSFRFLGLGGKIGFSKTIAVPEAKLNNFKGLVESFDAPKPPENLVLILQPNETLTFEDEFEIRQNFSFTRRTVPYAKTYKVWEGSTEKLNPRCGLCAEIGLPLSDANLILVRYEFSFLPYTKNPDFLEDLQFRWRKYGVLPVDANGLYSITSEPITNSQQYEKYQ